MFTVSCSSSGGSVQPEQGRHTVRIRRQAHSRIQPMVYPDEWHSSYPAMACGKRRMHEDVPQAHERHACNIRRQLY